MNLLTPTAKERARAHRDQQVAREYAAIRKVYPGASIARIVRTIAEGGKFQLSEPGIKQILYRTGTIPRKSRKTA